MRTGNESAVLEQTVKRYREGLTIGPLGLRIEEGFVTAVVGPNGSGKSTIFRLLMNLIQPDEGTVELFGERYPDAEVSIKRRIGYVPELSGYDMGARTVSDIVSFLSIWYSSWDAAECQRLMERFGIRPGSKLKGMSKGTLRKIDLIMALAAQPDLLLLDEPSSGLDPLASFDLIDELQRYMQQGDHTILIATHIQEEVWKLADYVVFLFEGQVIGTFEKDDLTDQWKAVWVEEIPQGADRLPGLLAIEGDGPYRLLTREYGRLAGQLKEAGFQMIRTEALELPAIMANLMKEKRQSHAARNG